VAFEDDRDERASVPDHRHRCYAEARPAPRALAHQQAYCLSSAFPVCPTFQDWARREAARAHDAAAATAATAAGAASMDASKGDSTDDGDDARPVLFPSDAGAAGPAAGAGAGALAAGAAGAPAPSEAAHDEPTDDSDEFGMRRNPPRDWAAPPPWLASSERAEGQPDAGAPAFLSHRTSDPAQGLAGSSADWLAGGPTAPQRPPSGTGSSATAGSVGAGTAAGAAGAAAAGIELSRSRRPDPNAELGGSHDESAAAFGDPSDPVSGQDAPRRPRRSRAYEQHLGGSDGPDWERPRRYESYPVIKTRAGLPNVSRLALMAGAIAIAAIALFFLPAILGLGSGGTPAGASGSPSAAAPSASVAPTPAPVATPALYTIKKNETLSKIATAHGITLDELLAANPQIKNPNQIREGQQITIPTPGASSDQGGASAQPS
jgi:LysM repeat protein